jgi:glutathione S-transferase
MKSHFAGAPNRIQLRRRTMALPRPCRIPRSAIVMKLYLDPVATTSRAVLALCHHAQLDAAIEPVRLMQGEHHQPPLSRLNPNRLVPVLDDAGFVLTEASAILRYLARRAGSRLYPEPLREAARVDELMAWFESNFYRDFGYQYIYPQLMPHHRRSSDEATQGTIHWGRDQSLRWLAVLDGHFLAHGNPYLLGDALSIADFFGGSILSLGQLVGCRFDDFPNVARWQSALERLESWRLANADYRRFAESLAGMPFVELGQRSLP